MYTSSANTTPLCGTIINRDPFYRFIADHFGLSGFLERHGMLCASGRRVRVVGPNDFWCCKRSRFLLFYWWPKLGDFFTLAAFMNRSFDIYNMIIMSLVWRNWNMSASNSPPIAGLAFPSNRHFARRCGHRVGRGIGDVCHLVVGEHYLSRKQTAHSLDFTGGSNCGAELGCGFKCFYFHPYLGKWSNLSIICFKWVETTN